MSHCEIKVKKIHMKISFDTMNSAKTISDTRFNISGFVRRGWVSKKIRLVHRSSWNWLQGT